MLINDQTITVMLISDQIVRVMLINDQIIMVMLISHLRAFSSNQSFITNKTLK